MTAPAAGAQTSFATKVATSSQDVLYQFMLALSFVYTPSSIALTALGIPQCSLADARAC